MSNYIDEGDSEYSQAMQKKNENALVASLGLTPFIDGDKWCILWGENLQDGVAGFGDTPSQAVYDFEKNYYSQKALTSKAPEIFPGTMDALNKLGT